MRIVTIAFAFLMMASAASAQASFEGEFDFRWLPDKDGSHREMMLLSDVAFVDEMGAEWPVPAGERTDGASIPPMLWSYAGTPFTGTYRRAAVIHDYYCRIGTKQAGAVHEVFRQGMIADGTSWHEAASKYGAVVLYDSAVSVFGEGCGLESRPLDELSRIVPLSYDQDLGATITDEALATIAQYEAVPFSEVPLAARVNGLIEVAQIQRRQTFENLVQFAAVPTRDNYLEIERSIAIEEPSLPQLDLLLQLARATFPRPDYSSQIVSNAPAS